MHISNRWLRCSRQKLCRPSTYLQSCISIQNTQHPKPKSESSTSDPPTLQRGSFHHADKAPAEVIPPTLPTPFRHDFERVCQGSSLGFCISQRVKMYERSADTLKVSLCSSASRPSLREFMTVVTDPYLVESVSSKSLSGCMSCC